MSDVKPRLSVYGRRLLIERVLAGRPVAHVVRELGVSRATGYKWLARYRAEGSAGLLDRSSRPHHSPHRTRRQVERQICSLRRSRKLGPARIAGILELNPSTVHRVLTRHGLSRLAWMDRPTGTMIRRYEMSRPGELVHVDIKKLGRIRPGGGWRIHGRGSAAWKHSVNEAMAARRVGYVFVHTAIDAHSRVAYSEILDDEQAVTAAAFWIRAHAWFAEHGIHVERVLTDNGSCYVSRVWRNQLAAAGITHSRTRPYRPQTNGKVERFNRTLLEEWAYVRLYSSDQVRERALTRWLHTYNHHRAHTALGGQPPISRVNDLAGHHS
jgi:transposase InsO family protein